MKIYFYPLESLPASFFSPLLRKWRNSEAVRNQMLHQKDISEEEHLFWYRKVTSSASTYRIRVAFAEEEPFGVIYLTDIDHESSTASWGMYIGEECFRGRGLAKSLLAALLFWGFDELFLFRMYTSVLDGNERALALYRKAGFQMEGVWRDHVVCACGRKDLLWIGMLREEWEMHKQRITTWR